ncbi:acyl-CoA dehydrogenase family protein [Blastococcus mobilis]|uniref:Acyl-CoA dehydrogenase n=1 Tax=Blastococcus mobilis TaxID=1938746 RepID=A0A238Y2D1_9ACTN|nr:acyl-CoA dehydrogenase family protein [Blastococcus mobilis]SNR65287.1 Acyl-CoA dehydrogenase [Blastococcus mobilis]
MTYAFTAEQEDLRRTARDLFGRTCTPGDVRAAWEPDADQDRSRWRRMADLGFLGANVPTEFGGSGLGDAELTVLLEEAGYAALPEPLLETAAIVVPILREHGSPEQRETWLPRIASGEVLATAQLMDAPAAPYGTVADLALLELDDGLHLVPGDRLTREPAPSMDGARHTAALRGVPDAGTRLPDAARVDARSRGAAAAAAVLNGVTRRLLDMTVAYAKEREQFGRPIGSFQAVKHLLAEVALEVETARPAAWYALTAVAEGHADAGLASSAAKAAANAAATTASYHTLQVHGGIGFTWEHDLHLWLKRGKALEFAYGSLRHHHRVLGDAVVTCPDLMATFGPALSAAS